MIYRVTNELGESAVHEAPDPATAVQAYLLHYGMLSCSGPLHINRPEAGEPVCDDPSCLDYVRELTQHDYLDR